MRLLFLVGPLAGVLVSCASPSPVRRGLASSDIVPAPRQIIEMVKLGKGEERQRVGLYLEDEGVPFKACVIYLEEFRDSFVNHLPLFHELQKSGYRVVSFDYLGQGGSEGDMAQTRINAKGEPAPTSSDFEIGEQAKRVWRHFANQCGTSKKFVIGWSVGGLAAYKLSYENWSAASVLIAPSLVPTVCTGEETDRSVRSCREKSFDMEQVMAEKPMTSALYPPGENPHLDPLRPSSALDAKPFAINWVSTAYNQAQYWRIPAKQRALVFLSGVDDTYVDRDATRDVLRRLAPNFRLFSFEEALHEIDNEVPETSGQLRQRTVEFFDSNLKP